MAASFDAARARRCDADIIVTLRCLIVDDNASFQHAARTLLEREGMTVVGLASNAAEALRGVRELHPDVVLIDIVLGHESGFDVARELVGSGGEGPTVIFISTHGEADFADLILETPAAGFVAKSELSAAAIERLIRSPSRET
jgi:DNA-binding NarL/FixJ family response regulator